MNPNNDQTVRFLRRPLNLTRLPFPLHHHTTSRPFWCGSVIWQISSARVAARSDATYRHPNSGRP